MKRLLILVPLAGAAIWVSVALATPPSGTKSTVMSIGTLNGDVAFNTGLPVTGNGLTWGTKHYSADQLPEFLLARRAEGVTSLGDWLNLHPSVSAAFGLVPIGVLHSPEIVTQTVNFPAGASSGWHTHPGFLVSTELTGTLTKYGTDCSSQTYDPGHSWTETGANTFIVKNETSAAASDIVTFIVPGGTPTTSLRIDKTQPSTCGK
jgi:quercetin dioxygenase-like cupin family protein